jgi:hypothetical protein
MDEKMAGMIYWVLFLPNLLLALPYALWAVWSYLFEASGQFWWSICGILGVIAVAIIKARGDDRLALFSIIALSAFNLYTFSRIG